MKKILYSILTFTFIFSLFALSSNQSFEASSTTESHSFMADWQGYTIEYPKQVEPGENLEVTIYMDMYDQGYEGITQLAFDENVDGSTEWFTADDIWRYPILSPSFGYGSFTIQTSDLAEGEYEIEFEGLEHYLNDEYTTHTENYTISFEIAESDTTPPEFDGDGLYFSDVDNPASLEDIEDELSAYDETDGDVSDSITLVEDDYSGNEGSTGDYETVWEASDSSGNIATTTVIVRVVDITPSEIELEGDETIYLEVHDSWSDPGATVTDNYDSNVDYTTSGSVDTSSLGTYTIEYNAVDSSGNEADTVTRTIIVEDTTAPIISLNGSDTIYIEYGDNYSEPGAEVTDNYDDDLDVDISGSVDVGTLGEYTITYNAVDSSGNEAETVTRTVIVQNTTPPTIDAEDRTTFNSSNNSLDDLISHFTANDSHDGDLTDDIEIIDDEYTGNETTVGEYEVTLSITNNEGTTTTETITIIVLDNIPPVISHSSFILDIEEADSMTQDEIRDHILGN